jgi:hypothetical protein
MELSNLGFTLIRNTIASYANLTVKPSTDSDKINTWVLQQSKVSGINFGPYYRAWAWPVTNATLATLAGLRLKPLALPPSFNLASPPPRPPPVPPPTPPPSPPRPPAAPVTMQVRCGDYTALLQGLALFNNTWTTSYLHLWGPATPLLGHPTKPGNWFAASARYGYGRAVVFTHEGVWDGLTRGTAGAGPQSGVRTHCSIRLSVQLAIALQRHRPLGHVICGCTKIRRCVDVLEERSAVGNGPWADWRRCKGAVLLRDRLAEEHRRRCHRRAGEPRARLCPMGVAACAAAASACQLRCRHKPGCRYAPPAPAHQQHGSHHRRSQGSSWPPPLHLLEPSTAAARCT